MLKQKPADSRVQAALALVNLWARRYDKSLSLYREVLRAHPELKNYYKGYINAAASASRLDARVDGPIITRLVDWARRDCSEDVEILPRLAWVCQRVENGPAAVALLQLACKAAPENDNLTLQLADVYVAFGEYDEAEQLARKLCQSRPNNRELRFHLAEVLAWSRRYDKAVQVYQEMLKQKPADSRVQTALALVNLWARRYDKSLSLYREVLLAHPELKNYYKGYIDAAASASRLDARVDGPIITRLVDWARRDRSEDVEILPRLAWVCQRVKNRRAALALLQLACKAAPEDDNLTLQLADLFYDMGRYGEAEKQYLDVARRTRERNSTRRHPQLDEGVSHSQGVHRGENGVRGDARPKPGRDIPVEGQAKVVVNVAPVVQGNAVLRLVPDMLCILEQIAAEGLPKR
jgi:tetratricopeptide (TPR) repeat protein